MDELRAVQDRIIDAQERFWGACLQRDTTQELIVPERKTGILMRERADRYYSNQLQKTFRDANIRLEAWASLINFQCVVGNAVMSSEMNEQLYDTVANGLRPYLYQTKDSEIGLFAQSAGSIGVQTFGPLVQFSAVQSTIDLFRATEALRDQGRLADSAVWDGIRDIEVSSAKRSGQGSLYHYYNLGEPQSWGEKSLTTTGHLYLSDLYPPNITPSR